MRDIDVRACRFGARTMGEHGLLPRDTRSSATGLDRIFCEVSPTGKSVRCERLP